MSKEKFIDKGFKKDSLSLIKLLNQILTEYEAQGYDLTLRQLYYQMVARDLFPEDRKWSWTGAKWKRDPNGTKNADPNYKWLGEKVNDARLAGLIDWDMITDRARETIYPSHWTDPAHILDNAARGFRINKWENQPVHVEVMVEKQALEGILIPVCQELDVRFTANKGYPSSTLMYQIGKRIGRMHWQWEKHIVIFYLGDHDPSGMDMTHDIEKRLCMFSGIELEVRRLALNMDQVRRWNPPENPAKETDARYGDYVEKYGEASWELDAVEPATLAELVRNAVLQVRDDDIWDEAEEREGAMRDKLFEYASNYRAENGDE